MECGLFGVLGMAGLFQVVLLGCGRELAVVLEVWGCTSSSGMSLCGKRNYRLLFGASSLYIESLRRLFLVDFSWRFLLFY